jgi:hypothetical protein
LIRPTARRPQASQPAPPAGDLLGTDHAGSCQSSGALDVRHHRAPSSLNHRPLAHPLLVQRDAAGVCFATLNIRLQCSEWTRE